MLIAIRNERSLREVATLLEAGRIDDLMTTVRRHARDFAQDVAQGYMRAGDRAAVAASESMGVRVRFRPMDERVVHMVRSNELRLIREITQEQEATIRQALTEGVRSGANPRAQARAFRDSIGLTRHQESAVRNYRRMLEEGSAEAMSRELRDRRFDRTLQRAIRGEKPLTRQQIDRMEQRYRERFIRHRSETIARTEALAAVHEGDAEAMRQMVDDGMVDAEELVREWVPGPRTAHARDFHQSMRGQTRGLNEPFESGRGVKLRFPGDPMAPVSERANCRCTIVTRIRRWRRRAA